MMWLCPYKPQGLRHQHHLSAVSLVPLLQQRSGDGWMGGGMLVSGSSISKDSGIIVFACSPHPPPHFASETQLVTRESPLPATPPRLQKPNTQPACWWWLTQTDWQPVSSTALGGNRTEGKDIRGETTTTLTAYCTVDLWRPRVMTTVTSDSFRNIDDCNTN